MTLYNFKKKLMETKDVNRNIKKPIKYKIFGGSYIKRESGNKKYIAEENDRRAAVRAKPINIKKFLLFKFLFSVLKFLYKI